MDEELQHKEAKDLEKDNVSETTHNETEKTLKSKKKSIYADEVLEDYLNKIGHLKNNKFSKYILFLLKVIQDFFSDDSLFEISIITKSDDFMKSLAEKYKFNDTEQNIILNEFKLRQLQMSDRKRKKKIIERLFYFIICIFIVVVLVIDPSHLLIPDNYFIITLMILFVISAFLLSSIADLAINILDTSLKHYLKDELIVLQEKLELEELAGTYEAKIEDKQFKQHQRELKRYYDMNLEQSKKVFALGIIVIFFGAMILIGTLLFFGPNANENILPLVVGCISGLLTDFVGIIFIRMYSSIVKTSVEFHNKLTYSNSLLLANLVTTRIVDCSVKDDTLKSIAQEIIKSSNQNLKECDLHFD
jgi:hypothetical protein